jgi:hypothetical protein
MHVQRPRRLQQTRDLGRRSEGLDNEVRGSKTANRHRLQHRQPANHREGVPRRTLSIPYLESDGDLQSLEDVRRTFKDGIGR